MGTKAGSRWMVVVVLWLALLCCPVNAVAQHQVGDKASRLTPVNGSEKQEDRTELFTGPVLALAALLLTALALAARPRRNRTVRPEAKSQNSRNTSGTGSGRPGGGAISPGSGSAGDMGGLLR